MKNIEKKYYLNLFFDDLAIGKVMEEIFIEASKKYSSEDLESIFEQNGIDLELVETYKNNFPDFNKPSFDNEADYISLLERSLSELSPEDIYKIKKLENSATILKNIFYNIWKQDIDFDKILDICEFLFDEDFKNKIAEKRKYIYIRTISPNSLKTPILKTLDTGKTSSFLTLKQFLEEFKEIEKNNLEMTLLYNNHGKGEKKPDLFLSINYKNTIGVNKSGKLSYNSKIDNYDTVFADDKLFDLTLKKLSQSFQGISKKTDFLQEINIFEKTLKEAFYTLSQIETLKKISFSEDLINCEKNINKTFLVLFNKILEINETENIKLALNSEFGNLNEQRNNMSDQHFYETVVALFENNKEDIALKLISDINSEINESLKKVKKTLKNSTDLIHLTKFSHKGKKHEQKNVDPKILKEIIFSLVNNKPLHVVGAPGIGKTNAIEEIFKRLGYNFFSVSSSQDPETQVSKLLDDNSPTIHSSQLPGTISSVSNLVLSGEKNNIIFFDEFAKILTILSKMGQGEKMNGLLQYLLDPTKSYYQFFNPLRNNFEEISQSTNFNGFFASNYSLNNEEIPPSFKSRMNEVSMNTIQFENPAYIFNVFDNLFDEKISKTMSFNPMILNSIRKLKEEDIFPDILELRKNDNINKIISSMEKHIPNFSFIKEDISKELIGLDREEKLLVKNNMDEIFNFVIFKNIIDKLKKKAELYNTYTKKIKKGISDEEISKATIEYNQNINEMKINSILSYLKLNRNEQKDWKKSLEESNNISDWTEIIYKKLLSNTYLAETFFYSDMSKDKIEITTRIKKILQEIVFSENHQLVILLSSSKFLSNAMKTPQGGLIKQSFENISKYLKIFYKEKTIDLFPIHNLSKSFFESGTISPETVSFKNEKSPYLFFDKNTISRNINPVNKYFDYYESLSKTVREVNKYIRQKILFLDDKGEKITEEDFLDLSSASTAIISYRELFNLMTNPEQINRQRLFGNFKKIYSNEEFKEFLNDINSIINNNLKPETGFIKDIDPSLI